MELWHHVLLQKHCNCPVAHPIAIVSHIQVRMADPKSIVQNSIHSILEAENKEDCPLHFLMCLVWVHHYGCEHSQRVQVLKLRLNHMLV